jgi:hypothetical protein
LSSVLVHILIATFLLGFVLCWLGWLWFIICRPEAWGRSISRQHALMLRYGLPPRWSKAMASWETGGWMKAVMTITILMAMWALRLL